MSHKVGLEKCQRVAIERGYLCLADTYVDAHTKIPWYCPKHDRVWFANAGNFIFTGTGCPDCGTENTRLSRLKYTIEMAKEYAEKNGFKCLSETLETSESKLKWYCDVPSHGEWESSYKSVVIIGTRCPKCSYQLRGESTRFTLEEVQKEVAPREITCLSTAYINTSAPMQWRCNKCNYEWTTKYMNIRNDHTGCPNCHSRVMEAMCRVVMGVLHGRAFVKKRPFQQYGYTLEIDCWSADTDVWLEYDGKQHDTGVFQGRRDEKIFIRDSIKTALCNALIKKLIRIKENGVGPSTLADVIIEKHKLLGIEFIAPDATMLARLQNPNDVMYQRGEGEDRIVNFKRLCAEHTHPTTGERGELLDTRWIRKDNKHRIRCEYGHIIQMTYGSVLRGQWCPVCGRKRINAANAERKIGLERCKTVAIERDGVCKSDVYIDSKTPMTWYCNKHHLAWSTSASQVVTLGKWCPECATERKRHIVRARWGGIEACKRIATEKNGACRSDEYTDSKTNLKWYCNKHKLEWAATPQAIIKKGSWCPKCAYERRARKMCLGIGRCRDYANLRGGWCLSEIDYVNTKTLLEWKCAQRHTWRATAGSVVVSKHWCPVCARERTNKAVARRRIGLEKCKQTAIERNGLCQSDAYINSSTPMRWHCNVHNIDWVATARNVVIRKHWCEKCARNILSRNAANRFKGQTPWNKGAKKSRNATHF